MLLCASVSSYSLVIKAEKLEVIDSPQNYMVIKLSEKQFTNMSDDTFTFSITICSTLLDLTGNTL